MVKKCIFFMMTIIFFLHSGATSKANEIFPFFNDEISDQSTIEIIDPVTGKVITSFIPDENQLLTDIQNYKRQIEQWVKQFSKGSKYNKPMILDRIDKNGEIIKGRPAISIDEDLLIEQILKLSLSDGVINLPLKYTNSDYRIEDVPYLTETVLTSYTTIFNGYQLGRSKNIELSSIAINNVIVGSGDIFSFNLVVGPREVATGYQVAPEIVNGKTVMGVGGGICQTSSTLFNAIDQLNVKTIERHHHSKDVGYVPKGRDATVSFGGLDYQFQNTTGIPFVIRTYYLPGVITVQIRTSSEYAEIFKNELR